jgi:hypothetical protein
MNSWETTNNAHKTQHYYKDKMFHVKHFITFHNNC